MYAIAEHDMHLCSSRLAGKGRGDLKESYYIANLDEGGSQPLPAILDEGKVDIAGFCGKCELLAGRLLQAFAVGLKVRGESVRW